MPNNKEHAWFTKRGYGVSAEDLHRWIDEPSKMLGSKHRLHRHDTNVWIPDRFVDKYGLYLSKAIVRSHIWLDYNWNWYQKHR